MKTLKTDVIIPAYRPGEEFEKLLERLSAQKYPINKILVMNTERNSGKRLGNRNIRLWKSGILQKKEFDHGGTRRQAAELSDAEILVFMTQDAMPADRGTDRSTGRSSCRESTGRSRLCASASKKDCRFLEKYTRSFNYPEQSCLKTEKDVQTYGIKTYFCSNVCAAYDHRIYDEIGGFPEHAIFNEDMIYAGWMVKKAMELPMYQKRVYIILTITPVCSSSIGILIWEFPRRSIRRFLKECLPKVRASGW